MMAEKKPKNPGGTTDKAAPKPKKRRGKKAGTYRIPNAVLGVIGIATILVLTFVSSIFDTLPVVGAGPKYSAYFSEAAGLTSDDEVRVAGVKVGKVSDVELEGDKVKVSFRAKDAFFGDDTRASIQIKSVLGQKYLALEPAGTEELSTDDTIPLDRTTSPYDVVTAFSQATEVLEGVDDDKLRDSLNVLSESMDLAPDQFRTAIDGVSRLSNTISSRDDELRRLLQATKESSRIVAERNEEFRKLIDGTGQLLTELNNRDDSIKLILASSIGLSQELRKLVADNEAQFGPTLDNLDKALGILTDHEQDLRKSIDQLGPFYKVYSNVLGNGRWFDSVVTNLLPPGAPEIPGIRAPMQQPVGG